MSIELHGSTLTRFIGSLVVAGALFVGCQVLEAQSAKQETFPSPQAAVAALVQAVKVNQQTNLEAILGPELMGSIHSIDPTEAAQDRATFLEYAQQHVKIEPAPDDPGKAIAYFGKDEWPFPAPLVKQNGWHFDGKTGVEEMLYRQIGRNELNAIDACHGYVDAQMDYAANDWMDDGVLQFAQRVASTPGKKDGLYWSNADGGPLSPLGPFIADTGRDPNGEPKPFNGYYFKILTAQGPDAKGGARSYIVDGRMVLGFALVAWPAEYGKSGTSTFLVNQLGVVYEKDLGPQTISEAQAMNSFNPGSGWHVVDDSD